MSTMLDASHLLAGVSAALLIVAIAVALSRRGRSQLRRLNGTVATDVGNLQTGAALLLPALGLGAVAAILAFADFAT